MVESMLIFCYYGEIHAHFCVLGWDVGDFGWNYGGMWVVRGGFMGEKLLHGDQERVVRVSPSHTPTLSTPCKSMHLCMKRSSPHASMPVSFSCPFQFNALVQSSKFAKKVLKPW